MWKLLARIGQSACEAASLCFSLLRAGSHQPRAPRVDSSQLRDVDPRGGSRRRRPALDRAQAQPQSRFGVPEVLRVGASQKFKFTPFARGRVKTPRGRTLSGPRVGASFWRSRFNSSRATSTARPAAGVDEFVNRHEGVLRHVFSGISTGREHATVTHPSSSRQTKRRRREENETFGTEVERERKRVCVRSDNEPTLGCLGESAATEAQPLEPQNHRQLSSGGQQASSAPLVEAPQIQVYARPKSAHVAPENCSQADIDAQDRARAEADARYRAQLPALMEFRAAYEAGLANLYRQRRADEIQYMAEMEAEAQRREAEAAAAHQLACLRPYHIEFLNQRREMERLEAEAQHRALVEAETEARRQAWLRQAQIEYETQLAARLEEEAQSRAMVEALEQHRARLETEAHYRAMYESEAQHRAQLETEAQYRAMVEAEAQHRARLETEAHYRAMFESEAHRRAQLETEAQLRAQLETEARYRAMVEAERRAQLEREVQLRAQLEREAHYRAMIEAQAHRAQSEAEESWYRAQFEPHTYQSPSVGADVDHLQAQGFAQASQAQAESQAGSNAHSHAMLQLRFPSEALDPFMRRIPAPEGSSSELSHQKPELLQANASRGAPSSQDTPAAAVAHESRPVAAGPMSRDSPRHLGQTRADVHVAAKFEEVKAEASSSAAQGQGRTAQQRASSPQHSPRHQQGKSPKRSNSF